MLDLNKNIIGLDGAIESENYYLYYQERSDEYGVDYTIIDKNKKAVDGGVFCYGDYNECTEMYDIDNGTEVVTFKEFFDYIGDEYDFDENSSEIEDEDLIEELSYID